MVDQQIVKKQIMQEVQKFQELLIQLCQQTADNYLTDLHSHIGSISGKTPYSDAEVSWAELDLTKESKDDKFWFETGLTASELAISVKQQNGKFSVSAGLMQGAKCLDEALWNEFGFTPRNSNRIVRRPIFVPIAEHHLQVLREKLQQVVKSSKLTIRIKL